jgi:hypothetical protein
VNLTSQGWNKSGLPRAIQLIASLFRQVPNVSTEVLAAYGDQNPFSSWHPLKHHLAAYVTSLGCSEDGIKDPAILWKSVPSKLVATGRAVLAEYDTQGGARSLSQPPQAGPVASSIDPDNIKRDSFCACFLIFGAKQTKHTRALQAILNRKLGVQGIPANADPTELHQCSRIVFMQAVVVEFFINKQQGAKPQKSNYQTLKEVSAGFVSHVFPKKRQFVCNRKHVGISAQTLERLWKSDIDSYDSLWNEVSKEDSPSSVVNHNIYILATKNLRPPSELKDAKNIVHAWLPPDRMDPQSRALHNIQVDACVNHSNQQALATFVLAGYGIISEQYLGIIENTRTTLRQLITDLRQAVVGSDDWKIKLERCSTFVEDNRLPGHNRSFNFN